MKNGEKKIGELLNRVKGSKPAPPGAERRRCARLIYPPDHRPRFQIRDHSMEVIDISESGLRLFLDNADVGQMVHGTVRFANGTHLDLTGKIVWQRGREVGLLVSRKPPVIPERLIYEEIRWLLRQSASGEDAESGAETAG